MLEHWLREILKILNRGQYMHWMWQAKLVSSQNASEVSDKMLQATGGAGYKVATHYLYVATSTSYYV